MSWMLISTYKSTPLSYQQLAKGGYDQYSRNRKELRDNSVNYNMGYSGMTPLGFNFNNYNQRQGNPQGEINNQKWMATNNPRNQVATQNGQIIPPGKSSPIPEREIFQPNQFNPYLGNIYGPPTSYSAINPQQYYKLGSPPRNPLSPQATANMNLYPASSINPNNPYNMSLTNLGEYVYSFYSTVPLNREIQRSDVPAPKPTLNFPPQENTNNSSPPLSPRFNNILFSSYFPFVHCPTPSCNICQYFLRLQGIYGPFLLSSPLYFCPYPIICILCQYYEHLNAYYSLSMAYDFNGNYWYSKPH